MIVSDKPSFSVEFLDAGEIVSGFKKERNLLDLAISHNWPVEHSCGGNGTCGTCCVIIVEGLERLPPRNEVEEEIAADRGFLPEERLACQLDLASKMEFKFKTRGS